jgi:tetratricopeptide (TPR) repeat protein
LEVFIKSRGVRPVALADECGYHRSHVLRIRHAEVEPTRDAIANIVSALRRLTLEDVRPDAVFELIAEESGPWHKRRGTNSFAREAAQFKVERDRARRLLVEVTKPPRAEWLGVLRRTPDGVTSAVARAAALEGRRWLDNKPSYAEALFGFAAAIADEAPDLTPEYRAFLSGRTRVDQVDAMRQLGRYREALPILDEAERRLEGVPACTHELGRAWFWRGVILFKMDGLDEAVRQVRRSVNVFAAVDDSRRLAQARLLEGNVLYEQGRTETARNLWLSIEPVFAAGRDRHTLASLWLNLGWCDLERGDAKAANVWLQRALERFTHIKSAADVARTRWALALIEARHGDRTAGLRALRKEQAQLASLDVTTEAGMVGLDIAEILLLDPEASPAEAVAICRDLSRLFERAGAKKEVLKALAYLWEATNRGAANAELVRKIRGEVKRAERDPNYTFSATAIGGVAHA